MSGTGASGNAKDLLDYFGVPGVSRVFVLGCLEPRVTIHDQQVRAANLIWSLATNEVSRRALRIGIVGAGFAGVTAAAAAAQIGWEPLLFDQNSRICQYQENSTRWVHPRIYDWPHPGWDDKHALDFMAWSPGPVNDIVRQIRGQNSASFRGAVEVVEFEASSRHVKLDYRPRKTRLRGQVALPETETVDYLILALGYGRERNPTSYWLPDSLEDFEPNSRWAVGGLGDGALIDALRLRLEVDESTGNIYEHIVELANLTPPVVRTQLAAIEKAANNERRYGADDNQLSNFLFERMQQVMSASEPQLNPLADRIEALLRADTTVKLVGNSDHPYRLKASPLNRWLIYLLTRWDRERFEFLPGTLHDPYYHPRGGGAPIDYRDHHVHMRDGSQPIFPASETHPIPWLRTVHAAIRGSASAPAPGRELARHPQWPQGWYQSHTSEQYYPCYLRAQPDLDENIPALFMRQHVNRPQAGVEILVGVGNPTELASLWQRYGADSDPSEDRGLVFWQAEVPLPNAPDPELPDTVYITDPSILRGLRRVDHD